MPTGPGDHDPVGEPGHAAHVTVGEGAPLLLLHATLSTSRELRRLAQQLAASYRVTSVDRLGSGASRLPPQARPRPIDVTVHVEALSVLIAQEKWAPVTLVGHSYGGCLALELAARQPRLVTRAWVYEPPYAPVGPPATRRLLQDVAQRTARAHEMEGLGAAAEAFLASVAGPDAVASLSPAARRRIRARGTAAVADASLLGLDPDGLASIDCPVTIATGTASSATYAEIADALAARIPAACHVRIEGLDHTAPVTHPATIARAILESAT